jgi:hypothetical protein
MAVSDTVSSDGRGRFPMILVTAELCQVTT